MGVQWIERNGQQILYFDHRDLTPNQIIDNLEAGNKMVAHMSGGLRVLSNFEGAMVDTTVMKFLKISGTQVIEPILEKAAVVGIHGLRNVLLQAYNRATGAGQNQKVFDTEEEALEWLTF
jgi:hypothetical protein